MREKTLIDERNIKWMVGEKLEPDRLMERASSLILGNRKDDERDDFQNSIGL